MHVYIYIHTYRSHNPCKKRTYQNRAFKVPPSLKNKFYQFLMVIQVWWERQLNKTRHIIGVTYCDNINNNRLHNHQCHDHDDNDDDDDEEEGGDDDDHHQHHHNHADRETRNDENNHDSHHIRHDHH